MPRGDYGTENDERSRAYRQELAGRTKVRSIATAFRSVALSRAGRCVRCKNIPHPCPSCGTPQCWCRGIDAIRRHWKPDGTPYPFAYEKDAVDAM